jgi:hypothetical protein
VSVPEPVQTAWDDVVGHWDDPVKHQALLGLIAQHNCFAWAAARYKERAGDPVADKQLERLRSSAVATMFAQASARKKEPPQPFRQTLFLLGALMLALVLGLIFVKVIHDSPRKPHVEAH